MRKHTIGAGLTNEEYENLHCSLKKRNQSMTEYGLMKLANVLKTGAIINKRHRNGKVAHVITLRVSDFVYQEVLDFIQVQGCKKTDLVAALFQELFENGQD